MRILELQDLKMAVLVEAGFLFIICCCLSFGLISEQIGERQARIEGFLGS